jgi:heptosyltransferase-1
LSRKEKPKPDPFALKKILLIRLRRSGDVIMTTAAVMALKAGLPQASLTYIVEEPFRRLVEGHPGLDRVIVIPAHQNTADFLRFVRQVRQERYDALIDFHGGPRASLLAFFSRAGLKVGYKLKYKRLFYDIRVPRGRKDGYIHSVDNHLNLVRALGIQVGQPPPRLTLPPAREQEKENIDRYWLENKLLGNKVAVLHIGAGNEFRDWGAENLTALATRLAGLPQVRVLLVGAEEDQRRAEEIRKNVPGPLFSAAGNFNLIELREIIARAVLFIGPDSGPMHIAATTSTPIVALFGPTLPANFSPWGANAILIQKKLDCRPCKQRHCVTQDFRCLRTIDPEEVYEACLRYLQE